MIICVKKHPFQLWSSHYDLHSMFGWSETKPTLRGVRASTGKRGLVLSRLSFFINMNVPYYYHQGAAEMVTKNRIAWKIPLSK